MRARFKRSPYCCGLYEIGAFGADPGWDDITTKSFKKTKLAFYSVTRWSDVKEKIWLRRQGFKKAGRWKNPNTRRVLTLWVYTPPKEKKRKK